MVMDRMGNLTVSFWVKPEKATLKRMKDQADVYGKVDERRKHILTVTDSQVQAET